MDYGLDWDDSQTDLAHLGGTAPGAAKSGGDKLWEDNWDDDDIEDDFSVQLRYARARLSANLRLSLMMSSLAFSRAAETSWRRRRATVAAQSLCSTEGGSSALIVPLLFATMFHRTLFVSMVSPFRKTL